MAQRLANLERKLLSFSTAVAMAQHSQDDRERGSDEKSNDDDQQRRRERDRQIDREGGAIRDRDAGRGQNREIARYTDGSEGNIKARGREVRISSPVLASNTRSFTHTPRSASTAPSHASASSSERHPDTHTPAHTKLRSSSDILERLELQKLQMQRLQVVYLWCICCVSVVSHSYLSIERTGLLFICLSAYPFVSRTLCVFVSPHSICRMQNYHNLMEEKEKVMVKMFKAKFVDKEMVVEVAAVSKVTFIPIVV